MALQVRAQTQHYRAQYPDAEWLVIELEAVEVGRLIRWQGGSEYRLIDFALLPDYRGRGLGSWLLRAELRRAEDLRLPLRLQVERSNPAQRLYTRLGLTLSGDNGVYLSMERAL